jgi:hypothetical protein
MELLRYSGRRGYGMRNFSGNAFELPNSRAMQNFLEFHLQQWRC